MTAYARTTHDGKAVDEITHQALLAVEKRLGYELTIVQGSYNTGGVSASSGTHDGGGVVDLTAFDWAKKVRALRAVGFAAWHRPTLPGVWGEHIHAVMIGNKNLAPAAARQVTAYRNGRDGLASNGPDDFWRPDPLPQFHMDAPPLPRIREQLRRKLAATKSPARKAWLTKILRTIRLGPKA